MLTYEVGAGGKFVSMCMALSPDIKCAMPTDTVYETSIKWFELKKKDGRHREYRERRMLEPDKLEEISNGKDYWVYTIHPDYVPADSHEKGLYLRVNDWPSCPKMHLVNYHWIIKAREREKKEIDLTYLKLGGSKMYPEINIGHEFNMLCVLDQKLWKKELSRLYTWLKVREPNWDHLEHMRKLWHETYYYGYDD